MQRNAPKHQFQSTIDVQSNFGNSVTPDKNDISPRKAAIAKAEEMLHQMSANKKDPIA